MLNNHSIKASRRIYVLRNHYSLLFLMISKTVHCRDDHTAAKTTVLENELESCKMLHEEETENKCNLFTLSFVYALQLASEGKLSGAGTCAG